MYSETLLEHFRNPRNVGELPVPPAIVAEVSNPACGDILRLSLRVDEGRVVAAAYKTRGCTASIAAGSALTELLLGRRIADLRMLTPADIEAALGGLPPESKHASVLCRDAVKAILKHLR